MSPNRTLCRQVYLDSMLTDAAGSFTYLYTYLCSRYIQRHELFQDDIGHYMMANYMTLSSREHSTPPPDLPSPSILGALYQLWAYMISVVDRQESVVRVQTNWPPNDSHYRHQL